MKKSVVYYIIAALICIPSTMVIRYSQSNSMNLTGVLAYIGLVLTVVFFVLARITDKKERTQ